MLTSLKNKFYKIIYKNFIKKNDIEYNKKKLEKNNFNQEKIHKKLEELNLFPNDNLSFNYHIFANFSSDKNLRILEIGTFMGKFANFLANIFPNSEITTIDIPHENSPDFIAHGKDEMNRRIEIKENFLKKKNIKPITMMSLSMLEHFEKNYFDMIFVDGDHLNPQVSIDIFQSIYLIKKGGIIVTDDNIVDEKASFDGVNLDSFQALSYLEKNGLISLDLFIKRYSFKNIKQKKYVSFSIKN